MLARVYTAPVYEVGSERVPLVEFPNRPVPEGRLSQQFDHVGLPVSETSK